MRDVGIVDVTFGKGVTVINPVNLYGCVIGEGCFIGPFVEIQRGVVIGKGCRIQSHAFICELVTVGEDCLSRTAQCSLMIFFRTGARKRAVRSLAVDEGW